MSQVTTPASKYCRLSKDQTLLELKVDDIRIGLSATAVEYRRLQSGFNEFEAVEKESVWSKIQDQLRNPLILLLLASASISFIMGQMDNAFSIAMAVTIVVTVAFIQEYQSEKSLEALNKLVPHMCRVLRSGHYEVISASLLVPGDIVALDMGNRVPADLRLLDSVDLELDESMLTGENRPSRKDYQWLPSPASSTSLQVIPLAERANIAFMGTLVKQGHGLGVVVGTGASTEFGVVFSMMRESEDVKTPLQIKMDELGKQLSLMSFAVIGVLSVLGLIRGRPMLEVFTIAVSLAVAAIPEGLPIVVTVTLALGVLRLTRKNVIVKKLPSVESLSAVDVICLDKTGTLTLNRLTVNKIYFAANKSTRDFLHETLDDTNDSYILRVSLVISGICNNARLIEQEFVGNAVDAALLGFIKTWRNRQIDSDKSEFVDVLRNCTKRIEDIPFNSDKKYMAIRASLHTEPEHDKLIMTLKNMSTNGTITSSAASKSGYGLYFVKGAPEYILSMCKTFVSMGREVKPLTSSDISFHLQQASMLSSSGLRTLALAYGTSLDDLVFCSILGMRDPPRPEISGTIRKFQACGIRPLMITGDSKETAVSIAHSVGIIKTIYRSEQGSSSGKNTDIKMTDFDTRNILSGSELENMTESDLCTRIESLAVLYRATPSHKVKVIQQLQRNGHVVAMSGDGVNDGPSLKIADVGISMGVGGTDVSKEAAKIILINDDLGSLISGIEEGKSIFHNIRGFIRFQLSTSLAALALVSISNLFGLPNPMNAMQILYINLIMDGAPAQSLGLEPVDSDVMSKPPRLKNKPILDWPLLRLIIVSAVCISIGTLSVFWQEMAFDGKVTARDRTMTFTTFVFFDMFNALACRSEHKSIFTLAPNRPLFISIAVSLVGQMMAIYVPFISNIFQTEPLSLHDITRVLIISSIVLWIDEIRKRWPFGTRETVETRGGSTSNAPLLPFSVNNVIKP